MSADIRLMQAADSVLCLLVFYPSMLFYWRGIWDLFGVYIYPDDEPKNHWVTTGIGACSFIGYFVYPLLDRLFTSRSDFVYILVSRVALYVQGILAMAYWRGVWGVADYYLLQYGWKGGVIGLLVSYTTLLLLRCSRTLIFSPFVVTLDTRKDVLQPSTLFQTEIKMDLSTGALKYVIDCLFTMYVVTTFTILSWRSALCLIEIYFFPSDKFISDLVSFLSGLAACITLFAVEPKLSYIKTYQERNRHSWWLRLLYEDLVYAVVFVSEWFLWRGGWNLNTSYVIADPLIGGWVNFVIGTVLLFALQLFSFVGGCGCSLDGQKSPNDVMFSTEYIRHWKSQHFQKADDCQSKTLDNEVDASAGAVA